MNTNTYANPPSEATIRMPLTRERIQANLQLLGDLPSPSPIVAHLTATLSRDDVEVIEVESIIHRDPVIAAKVVSAANAAAYASHTPTTTVRGALMRLGLLRVRRLTLLISLYNALPRWEAFHEAYWRHSLAVAHAAEVVVRRVGAWQPGSSPEALFLSGLVHDIGVLVLLSHYPKHYAAVTAFAGEQGASLSAAELTVLGIDHGDIGASLIEHWSLPDEIAQTVRYHHRPHLAAPEHRWAASVLRLADAACAREPTWDLGEGEQIEAGDPAVAELGIVGEALESLLDETRTEARRAMSVLENAR
jgi:HD-like signal output (HDOD) protein